MHCEAQRHVCVAPFNGPEFCRDFARELRRLADQYRCLPTYPEQLWFRALAAADAKDVERSVQARNAADDDVYFEKQHICSIAAGILVRDGFSAAAIHRTAAGATRLAPEIHEFKTPEDRRGGWRQRIAAAANGNG